MKIVHTMELMRSVFSLYSILLFEFSDIIKIYRRKFLSFVLKNRNFSSKMLYNVFHFHRQNACTTLWQHCSLSSPRCHNIHFKLFPCFRFNNFPRWEMSFAHCNCIIEDIPTFSHSFPFGIISDPNHVFFGGRHFLWNEMIFSI